MAERCCIVAGRIRYWKLEERDHLRAAHILNGSPIQSHALHFARRAQRHLKFWKTIHRWIGPHRIPESGDTNG